VDETAANAESRGHKQDGEQECSRKENEARPDDSRAPPLGGDRRHEQPALRLEAFRREIELRWK
jgi:hypothetical protein